MIPAWATWSDGGMAVHAGETVLNVPREPAAGWRYQTRLIGLPGGRLLLKSGDPTTGTALDVSVDNGPLGSVAGWPQRLARLSPEDVKVGADGVVSGLDVREREVIVWSPPDPVRVHRLPDDVRANDAIATSSGITVCGSANRRPAFAESDGDGSGTGWRIDDGAHGGFAHAWRRVPEYDRVHLIGRNLVLVSSVGDIGDETTWITWRTPRGHWAHASLGDDVPKAVLPAGDGGVQVVTHHGRLLTANGRGGFKSRRLRHDGAQLPAGSRIEILDAAYAERRLLLLASVRVGDDRWGEALIANGELMTVHKGPEAVAVTWT